VNLRLESCLELARQLHQAREVAARQAMDVGLNRALGITRASDLDATVDFRAALAKATGIALANVLHHIVDHDTYIGELSVAFSSALIDRAQLGGRSWTISLDGLTEDVAASHHDLVNVLNFSNVLGDAWAFRAASRFVEIALPIVTEPRLLTMENASTSRLMALCLAVEADAHQAHALGERFREIAAGITLLERRVMGTAPVTETIMLAAT
jgi:hypothetical protein